MNIGGCKQAAEWSSKLEVTVHRSRLEREKEAAEAARQFSLPFEASVLAAEHRHGPETERAVCWEQEEEHDICREVRDSPDGVTHYGACGRDRGKGPG